MPFAIDQEAMEGANMKALDINRPPLKQIPYIAFPKMVYLHPVDKTKEHRTKVVQNDDELQAALAQGWRKQPHVPQPPADPQIEAGEFEVEPARRGPGRPPKE